METQSRQARCSHPTTVGRREERRHLSYECGRHTPALSVGQRERALFLDPPPGPAISRKDFQLGEEIKVQDGKRVVGS